MIKASLLVAQLASAAWATDLCSGASAAPSGQPAVASRPAPAAAQPAAQKPAATSTPGSGNALPPSDPGPLPLEANKETTVSDDMSASRNAARTRMRECGHQWSGMKKSGAANGLTWKDFSQSCLARK